MALNTESKAALVFIVLYTILFALLILGYLTKRLRLRSRYTVITLHVTIRLAAQATGFAFGIVGYSDVGLLVAYFSLSIEGYFTLVLCAYRFLISWHYHNLEAHNSWLEPRVPPDTPTLQRIRDSFTLFGPDRNPMAIMHWILVVANCIIVSGGAILAGSQKSLDEYHRKLAKSKAMRATGQSIFLVITIALLVFVLRTIRQHRREQQQSKIHPTLLLLLILWPFLCVRGIYGILSGVYNPFNYFYPGNYVADGLSDSFVISEYILSTAMEWTSCSLLMCTYLTSKNDPPKPPLKSWKDQQREKELTSA